MADPGNVHTVAPLTVLLDGSVTPQPAINMTSVTLVVDDHVDVDPVGKQLHILGSERSAVPAGVIWAFGGATAPAGWLICDGSAISRSTYAALFATLGTAYGVGDGSTTFNIPPPGRVPVGKDGTTEFATLGQTGGAKTHLLTTPEIPSHNHLQDAHNHLQNDHGHTQNAHGHNLTPAMDMVEITAVDTAGTNRYAAASGTAHQSASATTATNLTTGATNQTTVATNQTAGGGTAHNNLPPYLVVNFIVKT